jgi:hypothetical protein
MNSEVVLEKLIKIREDFPVLLQQMGNVREMTKPLTDLDWLNLAKEEALFSYSMDWNSNDDDEVEKVTNYATEILKALGYGQVHIESMFEEERRHKSS